MIVAKKESVIEDVSCHHDGGLRSRKLAKLGRFYAKNLKRQPQIIHCSQFERQKIERFRFNYPDKSHLTIPMGVIILKVI